MPLPCHEIYDIGIAPSAEMVTDAMAATWVNERDEWIRQREEIHQSNEATLDHLTRTSANNLERMMEQAGEARARLLQQASEDLARMMEQVAAAQAAMQV